METMKAHLQAQLRSKEVENNRLATQLRVRLHGSLGIGSSFAPMDRIHSQGGVAQASYQVWLTEILAGDVSAINTQHDTQIE